jgi:hypothetical protein
MMIKLMLEVPALQSCVINLASWMGVEPRGHIEVQPLPGAPGHVVAGHAHGCGVLAGLLAAALVDGIIGAIRRWRPAVTARKQVTAQGDGV